ncbi:GNAT family N-acetyltransferase [Hymenobacter chitinivorans]|uniref:Diamine N-acetyltransferase n=1 Tax=Hymenobacter chitinivorans DSM 11115 TaxID=1121954 RepID=A0A2M9B9U9_9BACT|nr:GNAT family N-acetyltransferase [Hymenobacter chitinivorans]PJJ54712.1 diamine N-acetyltransferase [Hymenobacter chitinivorans DSM 11115]
MLQRGTVTLRALEESDLDFLFALENDPSIWGVSDTLAPVSRFALRQYLQHATADFYEVRQLRLVICADSQAVGTLDLFNFEPLHLRAGIGITIIASARQQGYAQAALELLLGYARHTLRLHQLYCTVAADNTASLRLFEQGGFCQVGVRKEWLRKDFFWQDAVEFQYILDKKSTDSE